MQQGMRSFWEWYERTYALNVGIALGLFLLQLVHLVWLSGYVAWAEVFGASLFQFTGFWEKVIILVDYTEIPALLSISLIYINELRRGWSGRAARYLVFLNLQWLHIFWITDEFVETAFNVGGTVLPLWLAWVAIGIDYLELPVMVDTLRRFVQAVRERRTTEFLKHDFREESPE